MCAAFEIRPITESEIGTAAGLLAEAFGRWPLEEVAVERAEHLRWKLSPPYRDVAVSQLAAFEGGRMIATCFHAIQPVRVRGRDYLSLAGVDHAVAPTAQGRGVYRHLVEYQRAQVLARFDCSFGNYSRNPTVHHVHPRVEPEILADPLRLALRIGSLRSAMRAAGGSRSRDVSLRTLARVALHLASPARRHRPEPPPAEIRSLERFPAAVDALWDRAAEPFELAFVRDRERLNWRYCDPRSGGYDCRGWLEGEDMAGYSVTAVRGEVGHLVDLWSAPDRADVLARLWDDAVLRLTARGAGLIRCWTFASHPWRDQLRRLGFFLLQGSVDNQYRRLRPQGPDLGFLSRPGASIHLALGDSDLV